MMAVGDVYRDRATGLEYEVVWDGTCEGTVWPPGPGGSSLTDATREREPRRGAERQPEPQRQSTLDRARAEVERLLPRLNQRKGAST